MNREEFYIIPENFKKGNYIFNKFRAIDLIILVSCSVIGVVTIISSLMIASSLINPIIGMVGIGLGGFIVLAGLLLTINLPYYHNVLGKLMCILRYLTKEKTFKWKGVSYINYEKK